MNLDYKPSIGSYIGYFYRYGQSFLIKEYKDYGIGAGQYQFLVNLYMKDGISHDELTEKMSVDKATTTRSIIKLEESGYVVRKINEKDKRKYHIYLTEKAIKRKEEILKIASMWEDKLIGDLTERELDELHHILSKIAKSMPGYFFSEGSKDK